MGGLFFLSRRGSLTCKFWFVVDAGGDPEGRVVLNPKEHVRHLWATEDEVREKRIAPRDGGDGDGERLVFTSRNQWEVILEAFKLWK